MHSSKAMRCCVLILLHMDPSQGPDRCREAGGKQQEQLVQNLQSQLAQAQAQLTLKEASTKKYKVF